MHYNERAWKSALPSSSSESEFSESELSSDNPQFCIGFMVIVSAESSQSNCWSFEICFNQMARNKSIIRIGYIIGKSCNSTYLHWHMFATLSWCIASTRWCAVVAYPCDGDAAYEQNERYTDDNNEHRWLPGWLDWNWFGEMISMLLRVWMGDR